MPSFNWSLHIQELFFLEWSGDGTPRCHPGGIRGLQEGHQRHQDEPRCRGLQVTAAGVHRSLYC